MSNCCKYRRDYNNDNFMNNQFYNNITTSNNGMVTDCNTCTRCNNSCDRLQSVFPDNYLYGYAYTPVQTMNETFNPQIGLQKGTIFPELVSPYCPGQSMDFINSLRSGGCQNG